MTLKIKPNELICICIYLKTSNNYQLNEKVLEMLLAMFGSYNKHNYNYKYNNYNYEIDEKLINNKKYKL